MEKRSEELDYIFVDTPGQIEAFTWSAGGQIIHELLATAFPTVILYITDTPRCSSPTTFMSNMLYASSVLYKSQLPMVVAFNKTDVVPYAFAKEWMEDFEAFQEALVSDGKEEYMTSLNRSLSLVMDEFYTNIHNVGVSAATGEGIEDMFAQIDNAAIEFNETYLPDLKKRLTSRKAAEEVKKTADWQRLQTDLAATQGDKLVVDAAKKEGGVSK
jgi:GTPase SAR1 family protein